MRSMLLAIVSLAGIGWSPSAQGQTPLTPSAQALLDRARTASPARFQFAVDHGAKIAGTGDGRSFYLLWMPPDAIPEQTPLIVTLHGSSSWAFDEMFLWYEAAKEAGCGVLALQWWFADGELPNSYYSPDAIQREFHSAIQDAGTPPGRALLHGFSRGSAHIYAVAALDRAANDRLYGMVIANSGGAASDFPPNVDITNGKYGYNIFSGTYWTLFCGELDPNPDRDGCPAMRRTAQWLGRYGGVVDVTIEDASAGHGGFHQTPAHLQKALKAFSQILEKQAGALPLGTVAAIRRDPDFEIRGAGIPNVGWMGDEAWLVVGTRQGARLYRSPDGSNSSEGGVVPGLLEAFAGSGFGPAEVVPRLLADGRRGLFVLGLGPPGSNRATVFRLVENAGSRFEHNPPQSVFPDEPFAGVPDIADAGGGNLYLTYVSLSSNPRNSRVAYSEDGGTTFHPLFENPFGDLAVPNPKAQDINVDPAMLRLSRGSYLAVGMRAARLYLFAGIDGRTFVPLTSQAIEPETLSPGATGLFDPTLLQLPDGRIFLYTTAGAAPDGSDSRVVRAEIVLTEPSRQ